MGSAVVMIVVFLVLVWVRPAYAYLDPGSGGMMVQLLLGGFAGAAVLVRLYWRQLLNRVGLRKPDVSNETNS
jgi:Na+/proline symporter